MTGDPYLAVFQRSTIIGVTIKSDKHGSKYLKLTLEVPLDGDVDVNALAHELYGQPSKVTIESVQLGFVEQEEVTG